MSTPPTASTVRFGRVTVLPTQRRVLVDGEPVRIGTRAYDVMQVLLERGGEIVSKRELLHEVWRGVFVEENNLEVQVCALRKALGASAIVTVPGRGYSFDNSIAVNRSDGPLSPVASRIANAPADVAPLRGRAQECAALARLVREHRMVTVTGPGGIGKTRIVREVLAGVGLAGVRVDLAMQPPGTSVAAIVARALGLEFGTLPSVKQLVRAAEHANELLVLENAELCAGDAAAVVDALMECTQLRVVCTAQVLLHSHGEHVLRLAPLALPAADCDKADAHRSPAIELLFDTVSALKLRGEFSEREVQDACAICRHLDGNPLAIELAGAHVEVLGMSGLRRRLGARFQLLVASTRDTVARQQSLLATMAWSWRLLTNLEKSALAVLARFPGRFTFGMARKVLGRDVPTEWEAMQALESLMDKSVVIADMDGRNGFRIPESMRLFALRGPS